MVLSFIAFFYLTSPSAGNDGKVSNSAVCAIDASTHTNV